MYHQQIDEVADQEVLSVARKGCSEKQFGGTNPEQALSTRTIEAGKLPAHSSRL